MIASQPSRFRLLAARPDSSASSPISRLWRGLLASLFLLPLPLIPAPEAEAQTRPVITIVLDTASPITEGRAASYTLTATPAPSAALTVNLNVADVAGSDFIAAADEGAKTVEIPTSGTATYTVATVNDSLYDTDGDVTVTVVADGAYTVGSPAASITVEDNDRPTVSMRFSTESAPENGALREAKIRVIPGLSSALTVSYSLNGTADCGMDYTLDGAGCVAGTGSLTIPAGTRSHAEIELPIRLMADSVDDNGETIIVTLTKGAGTYTLSPDKVYTATITAPLSVPVLTLSTTTPVITEGRPVGITLTSNKALPGQSLSLRWKPLDDPDADFLDNEVPASNGNAIWNFEFAADDSGMTSRSFTIPTQCDPTSKSGMIRVDIRDRPTEYIVKNPTFVTVTVNGSGNCRRATRPPPSVALPTFGAGSIVNQTWTQGQEIDPLQFPQATGGTGTLIYSLSPAAPSGLLYDASAYRLSGIPSQTQTQTQYAWTATDENGATATLTFSITVTDVAQLSIQDVVRSALAALARRSLSSAITNINTRFADLSGSGLTLAGHAAPFGASATPEEWLPCPAHEGHSGLQNPARALCSIHSRGLRSAELLDNSDFSFVLGATETEGAYTVETPRWSVWGRGDRGSFAGGEQNRYDGNLRGGWLGVDARAGAWVAGLAFSRSEGESSYTTEEDRGELETTLDGIYPYGRWTLNNGLEIRAVLGSADGEARHTPEDGALQTSDLSMRLGSLGLRKELEPRGKIQRAFRLDASHSTLKTQEGTEILHGLTADSWRIRAGVEISRKLSLPERREWEPFLEVSARKDGGDGLRGEGIELAGGVRYRAPGLSIEAKGRWLAAHSESETRESGFSVTARGGAGAGGRGLWFALEPRWGAKSEAGALWDDAVPQIQGPSKSALDARIGYGLSLSNGILTPFAETALGEQRTVRFGTRFASPVGWGLELVTERIEDTDREARSLLKLNLRHSF